MPLMLGRIFNGSGVPIDGGPPVMPEVLLDIQAGQACSDCLLIVHLCLPRRAAPQSPPLGWLPLCTRHSPTTAVQAHRTQLSRLTEHNCRGHQTQLLRLTKHSWLFHVRPETRLAVHSVPVHIHILLLNRLSLLQRPRTDLLCTVY